MDKLPAREVPIAKERKNNAEKRVAKAAYAWIAVAAIPMGPMKSSPKLINRMQPTSARNGTELAPVKEPTPAFPCPPTRVRRP